MAGFQTHITFSTILGVGYGAAGYFVFNLPAPACVLAGGLCSVSGMLPDLDSDSGIPLRESLSLASAVVPMLMMKRFSRMGLTHEWMVLAGAAIYLAIRFGFGWFLKKYTVHRGMFHSLPAALIFGMLAFLICGGAETEMDDRFYKAGAVLLGFMSHLLLDEIWSIEVARGRFRLKSSFGTAMKIYDPKNFWPNLSTYAKLVLLTYICIKDPSWMKGLDRKIPRAGMEMAGKVREEYQKLEPIRK